ncbi:MAG: hypothetical protein GY856_24980 [bacterium]|nr:hypothetical protein [bacterium]
MGQEPAESTPAAGSQETTELVLATGERADVWVEVTTFGYRAEVRSFFPGPEEKSLILEDIPDGPAMICAGGAGVAVDCHQHVLGSEGRVELELRDGIGVRGRYACGDRPCAEALVAVVPRDLRIPALFKIPLSRKREELIREVKTNAKGRFVIPALAPGSYLLETQLADGRLHHSEPFTVPSPLEMRRAEAEESETPPALDLGTILVEEGLDIEFFVTGSDGQSLAAVLVGGGQGTDPADQRLFQARTDDSGFARVSGWSPDRPVRTTCTGDGFVTIRQEFEQPPALVECVLEPFAEIAGKVVDPEGEPVAQATITTRLRHGGQRRTTADAEGQFRFGDLESGSYALVIAASGFMVAEREVDLQPGEARRLSPVEMEYGEALAGQVLDAQTREPVPGAEVWVHDPPGGGSTHSDTEGNFILTTDLTRTLRLLVSAEGYAEQPVAVDPAGEEDEELVVELSPGGRIRVVIFDDELGAPCVGCRVSIQPTRSGRGYLQTDARGEASSELLAPGRYEVSRDRITNLGSAIFVQGGMEFKQVSVGPGQISTVRFGEEKIRLRVWVRPALPAGWEVESKTPAGSGRLTPQPDGSLVVTRNVGESTELYLFSTGELYSRIRLRRISAEDTASDLELELPQTVVSGTLVAEESPFRGERIQLVSLPDLAVIADTLTDDSGTFTVPYVPPGGYGLLAAGQIVRTLRVREGQRETLEKVELTWTPDGGYPGGISAPKGAATHPEKNPSH